MVSENTPPPSLEELDARIKAARGEEEESSEPLSTGDMAMGWRLSIELVAGVVVGTALGHFLDKWLDTNPVFVLLGILFGAAAGFYNMIKSVRGM